MKRFSFRLQNVLNLREQEEQLWKLKLGQAAQKVAEIDEGITRTKKEERRGLDEYRDPRAMYSAQLYMLRMKAEREKLVVERVKAEEKRLEVLADYTGARQKSEVLRKLRTHHMDDWRKAYLETQDVEADDLNSSRRTLLNQAPAGVY